jgi:RHS repeat-associated protein
MATVRYTTVDGEILAEKRSGARKWYVPDALGSTVALLDSGQALTDTFGYWPYGEERTRTGTTPTPFRFAGTLGSYRDTAGRAYVRLRQLNTGMGRWLSPDPIVFDPATGSLYTYVFNNPTSWIDPAGAAPKPPRKRHPCEDRTDQYCGSYMRTANRGLYCVCYVSNLICKAIRRIDLPSGVDDKAIEWLDCMNRCMFNLWRHYPTREWKEAAKICRDTGQKTQECCKATILADQKAFDFCVENRCGKMPLPKLLEILKVATLRTGCCDIFNPPCNSSDQGSSSG